MATTGGFLWFCSWSTRHQFSIPTILFVADDHRNGFFCISRLKMVETSTSAISASIKLRTTWKAKACKGHQHPQNTLESEIRSYRLTKNAHFPRPKPSAVWKPALFWSPHRWVSSTKETIRPVRPFKSLAPGTKTTQIPTNNQSKSYGAYWSLAIRSNWPS